MESQAFVPRLIQTDSDADEFAEELTSVTGPIRFSPVGRRFCGSAKVVNLPRLSLFKIQVDNTHVTVPGPHTFFSTTLPLRAPIEVCTGSSFEAFDPGSAHFLNNAEELAIRTAESGPLLVANFSESLLHSLLGEREQSGWRERYRDRKSFSLTTPEGSAFYRELSSLWRDMAGERFQSYPPAVLRDREESLAELFLLSVGAACAVVPDSRKTSLSSHLSRAADYIMSHLDEPLSVSRVAAAVDVSSRTLSRAFGKRYGMSTCRFIRMRRLEAAHRALLAAEPGAGQISEIALSHGFTELGRFAGLFKGEFLESPSETLHR